MKKILITILILLSCIVTLTYSQIGYECTVTQSINGSNLEISLYIRSTGSTNFILGGANFVTNVNTSSLNITNVPSEISEGLWDNGNDPTDYADQFNSRNASAGWVGINIDYQYTGNGVQVPTSETLIGTMSIPIVNTTLNSNVTWRVSGLNKVEVLDKDGNDITALGIFTNPAVFPLPVELTSFAVKQLGEKVDLSWQTKTEVNNYGFEVERAVVTKGSADHEFQKIGFIKGSGNSNSPKNYNYADNKLTGGSEFIYRLKQVDTDGGYSYSSEQHVTITPTEYKLSQNYPNPFNPATTISWELPTNSQVTLKIYDMLGKEVTTLVNEEKPAGFYSIQFSTASLDLSSGLYIYQLRAGNFVQTKKMMLQK